MAMPPGLAAYIAGKSKGGDGLKKEVYEKGKGKKKVSSKAKTDAIARRLNKKG